MNDYYDNDFTEQMTRVLQEKIHLRRSQFGSDRLDERDAMDVIISGGLLEILRVANGHELHFLTPDPKTGQSCSAFWVKVPALDSDDLAEIGEFISTDDVLEIITVTQDLTPIVRLIMNLARYLSSQEYNDQGLYQFRMRGEQSPV